MDEKTRYSCYPVIYTVKSSVQVDAIWPNTQHNVIPVDDCYLHDVRGSLVRTARYQTLSN